MTLDFWFYDLKSACWFIGYFGVMDEKKKLLLVDLGAMVTAVIGIKR